MCNFFLRLFFNRPMIKIISCSTALNYSMYDFFYKMRSNDEKQTFDDLII